MTLTYHLNERNRILVFTDKNSQCYKMSKRVYSGRHIQSFFPILKSKKTFKRSSEKLSNLNYDIDTQAIRKHFKKRGKSSVELFVLQTRKGFVSLETFVNKICETNHKIKERLDRVIRILHIIYNTLHTLWRTNHFVHGNLTMQNCFVKSKTEFGEPNPIYFTGITYSYFVNSDNKISKQILKQYFYKKDRKLGEKLLRKSSWGFIFDIAQIFMKCVFYLNSKLDIDNLRHQLNRDRDQNTNNINQEQRNELFHYLLDQFLKLDDVQTKGKKIKKVIKKLWKRKSRATIMSEIIHASKNNNHDNNNSMTNLNSKFKSLSNKISSKQSSESKSNSPSSDSISKSSSKSMAQSPSKMKKIRSRSRAQPPQSDSFQTKMRSPWQFAAFRNKLKKRSKS